MKNNSPTSLFVAVNLIIVLVWMGILSFWGFIFWVIYRVYMSPAVQNALGY